MCACRVSYLFPIESPLNFGSACWPMRVAVALCMNKCYWAMIVGWTGGFHLWFYGQSYCSCCSVTHETTPAPGHVQRNSQWWDWKSVKMREGRELDFPPCKFAVGHQSRIVCSETHSQHSCNRNCFLPHLTVRAEECINAWVKGIHSSIQFHLYIAQIHHQYSSCEGQNIQNIM